MPEAFKKLTGYTDFNTEGILFNMKEDSEQRNNLYDQHPDRVNDLKILLEAYRKGESSVKNPETNHN
jgi:arylsulfatase A